MLFCKWCEDGDLDDITADGRKAVLALHYGRNEGIGSRAEYGTLPTAQYQQTMNTEVELAYSYGRIELSGPVMRQTRAPKGAFIKAMDLEMKRVQIDMRKDVNRQFWGDGTAALTPCDTTSGAATVVVESTQYISAGMVVDIRNSTTGATISDGDSVTVLTVPSSTTFTVGDAVTTASSHSVYREDTAAASGGALVDYEMNGLRNIINTTAECQGIDPASYTFWRPADNAMDDSTTSISDLEDLQAIVDAIEDEGGKVDVLFTTRKARRQFYGLLVPDVRFQNNGRTPKGKGGLKVATLAFNDTPFEVDKDIYTGDGTEKVYFIDSDHLFLYRASDFDWMDEDGAILNRVSNKDAYEATLFYYANLATDRRNVFGAMTAIN